MSCFDNTSITFQQRMSIITNVLISINHQYATVHELGTGFDLDTCWHRFSWSHFAANFLDHLFNIASIAKNFLQSLHDLRFMPNVAFHHVDRIVETVKLLLRK